MNWSFVILSLYAGFKICVASSGSLKSLVVLMHASCGGQSGSRLMEEDPQLIGMLVILLRGFHVASMFP